MIKKNFLYKTLCLYGGIVLLYTIIISGFTLFQGFRLSSVKNKYSNESYLHQVSSYADTKFTMAIELANKISTLNTLMDYKYSPDTNYVYITNLHNDLGKYMSGFNHLGISLGITKFSEDIVVTPIGTYSTERYMDEIGIDISKFKQFQDKQLVQNDFKAYILPRSVMKETANKVVLLYQPTGNNERYPVYFFLVLNSDFLVPQQNEMDFGGLYLYAGELVYSYGQQPEFMDKAGDIIDGFPREEIVYRQVDKMDSYTLRSEMVPDLAYIYTVPQTSLLSIFFSVLQASFLPGVGLLLIGIAVSYQSAQSSYRPIKQLVKMIDEQQTDAEPPKEDLGELDYIRSNIQKIYSANSNLQNKLRYSTLPLQENFFRKIIYGIVAEDSIQETAATLQLEPFLDTPLQMLLLEVDGIEAINQILPIKSFSILLYEFIESCQMVSTKFNVFILPLDTKRYCIVVNNLSAEEAQALSNGLIEKISTDLSLDITLCLSGKYYLKELTSAFQELLMLNKYKYTLNDDRIITSESIKNMKEVTYYYPLEVETHIIGYITNNEKEKAENLFVDMIEKNLAEMGAAPVNFTNLKYSMITTFKRCLNAEGKALALFIKEYPKGIEGLLEADRNSFKQASLGLFDKIFEYCNREKLSLENSTAASVFMYIHENFDKDISLTDIATHFNLSESYVSKLLKNSLDINFKTYTNQLKVKKAKELLAQGIYKVNEVSSIVGCNNTNTFIRIFKQYEGVSPGEYVKNISIHQQS